YQWTQWIFLQLFHSFYDRIAGKARPIRDLEAAFAANGNAEHECPGDPNIRFTAETWQQFSYPQQQEILMHYRLAYCGYGEVNWCEALGTVLANDEVINGVSERGGHPVVKKKLRQWYLRITEYADRLLAGLNTIEFSEAMKEMQTNWIGKSYGAEIDFAVRTESGKAVPPLRVYTTRPDTIFGVDFMVIAPEHTIIPDITSAAQAKAVDEYLAYVKSRSERERQAEKKISGCFTGGYAINPFNGQEIPIWISEYVLAGYGTGAIMAVPCGDERDFKFARHFNIPITNIIGHHYNGEEANPTKEAVLENSGFLDGMLMRDAINTVISRLEEIGIGQRKTHYKMRDAAFSRQRYWGEPFPIQWNNGIAIPLPESELPLLLPNVESYSPGPEGEGPLANIREWQDRELETNTMPGYAGSSWYFLRYMDPHNTESFCDRKLSDYWNQVDVYVGGTEHAVGHLLYSRMWTKVLYDLGHIGFEEPFRKLLNQGMIQGSSRFVYRKHGTQTFVSKGLVENMEEVDPIRVDVNLVNGFELDTEAFKKWRNNEHADAVFMLEDGKYICGAEVEKMSKSKFNTVDPTDLVEKFGADTFRMYEMFLGPVEQSKPWDTKGIEGVHRFLKKLWRLFYDEQKGRIWNQETPTPAEWKVLHRTIKKIEEDTERFSFNTAVSAFMICVNELADLHCHKQAILEPLVILLAPYAPHIAEELYQALHGSADAAHSVLDAAFPVFDPKYLVESEKEYPVSINGKLRTSLTISLDATQAEVEAAVLANELVQKWMEGKPLKKLIYVKGKMINVVV
ncbi:MAG TPA: leucine--tRNA ligase, partial [Sediminibacterium sp.]|nr:leucine--tRNA ligase [Sediminibacterium sp.]